MFFADLSMSEQAALVVDSLEKNQEIKVGNYHYKVTMKKEKEMRIKRLSDGKNGTILKFNTQNVAWMKNRKDGVATGFFRDIESDISRVLADFNNPFLEKNDSYNIAIQAFESREYLQ